MSQMRRLETHLSWGMGETRRAVVFAPWPRKVRVSTLERRMASFLGRAARETRESARKVRSVVVRCMTGYSSSQPWDG
jgi:hypothetical protein